MQYPTQPPAYGADAAANPGLRYYPPPGATPYPPAPVAQYAPGQGYGQPSPGGYAAPQPGYATPQFATPQFVTAAPAPQQQQQQQVVVVNSSPQQPIIVAQRVDSYVGHIVFSCFVLWCCSPLCGLIAFILAGKQSPFGTTPCFYTPDINNAVLFIVGKCTYTI